MRPVERWPTRTRRGRRQRSGRWRSRRPPSGGSSELADAPVLPDDRDPHGEPVVGGRDEPNPRPACAGTDVFHSSSAKLLSRLEQLPGLTDVSSDLLLTNPQVNIALDRDRIGALGLTADQVEGALNSAFGQRQVAQIYAPNNAYQVIMRVAPEYQRDPPR